MYKKKPICPQTTSRKNAKTKKLKQKNMKVFTIFGGFRGQNKFLWKIFETTFTIQLSLNNIFFF